MASKSARLRYHYFPSMNSNASSSAGQPSNSYPAQTPTKAAQESVTNGKARQINSEGRKLLEHWFQVNRTNGKLYDKQSRKDIIDAIVAAGNPHYRANNLSGYLSRNKSKIATVVSVQLSEEEILFPGLNKEMLSAIKWLYFNSAFNNNSELLQWVASLNPGGKDFFTYVQYIDKISKTSKADENRLPTFYGLLPSLSIKDKGLLISLYRERPDASDAIALTWGERLCIQPVLYALFFVRCLQAHQKKLKTPVTNLISQNATLSGNTHLPTPSLSASPELPSRRLEMPGSAVPTPKSPISHNSTTHMPPASLLVKRERSPTPYIVRTSVEISEAVTSSTLNAQSPLESPPQIENNNPPTVTPDPNSGSQPMRKDSREISAPPITRLIPSTDSSSITSSQIDTGTNLTVTALSFTASAGSESVEEDQLVEDHDGDNDSNTAHYSVTETETVEYPPWMSTSRYTPLTSPDRMEYAEEDTDPAVDYNGTSTHSILFDEKSPPTTVQELLDRISCYEGLLDDLLTIADAAPV